MKLKSVFIRFYKSFNYDYVRKITEGVTQRPWDMVKGQYYPFIEVPLDPKITTVVGANESGKSHLLSAIEKGLTGVSTAGGGTTGIELRDMCRYSHFFTATQDGIHHPDFGFEWIAEDGEDAATVRAVCGIPDARPITSFFLFRIGNSEPAVFLPATNGKEFDSYHVNRKPASWLPHVFRIESAIALPDSVSIDMLLAGRQQNPASWPAPERSYAARLVDLIPELEALLSQIPVPNPQPNGTSTISVDQHKGLQQLRSLLRHDHLDLREGEVKRKAAEFNLAYDLIFEIARIDRQSLQLLRNAIREGNTGIVRTIEDKINAALEIRLNFARVWAQDRDFSLRVKATDFDLDFIIGDRTGGHYTFGERSSGLKHFLSYYIQYLVHKGTGRSEILLMDEPDAFLSGEAQQDLLKVFEMFADPNLAPGGPAGRVPVQVIYVTHSPFLINKNHAERVRALEKAEGAKGTRVIGSAAQNRYEPLRSAFGPFVGETTFISRCNLMVEGPADQILLAGAAAYLRKLQDVPETQMLDLNHISIVPAGGGMSIPYMVYLARGRDTEKPAVIVLLDSDSEGDDAKKNMTKAGPHPENSASLPAQFIVQLGDVRCNEHLESGASIGDNSGGHPSEHPFQVLEDLVPPALAVRAAHTFLKQVYRYEDADLAGLTEDAVRAKAAEVAEKEEAPLKAPYFQAIQAIIAQMDPERAMNMGKVAFARTVIDLLPILREEEVANGARNSGSGLREFESNLRALFSRLHRLQRSAERDVNDKRMRQKVEEKIRTFESDFGPGSRPTRDDAARLLVDIESDLTGDDAEATLIRHEIVRIRQRHRLTEDLTEPVREIDAFHEALGRLRNARQLAMKNAPAIAPRKERPRTLPALENIERQKETAEIVEPVPVTTTDALGTEELLPQPAVSSLGSPV